MGMRDVLEALERKSEAIRARSRAIRAQTAAIEAEDRADREVLAAARAELDAIFRDLDRLRFGSAASEVRGELRDRIAVVRQVIVLVRRKPDGQG